MAQEKTLHDLFVDTLKDIYFAERHILKALPKMAKAAAKYADFLVVTSDNPRDEEPEAIIADILPGLKETHTPYVVRPDRREAIAYAIENHCPGDVIILCGKGHEDYQIIGKTKVHMDEREIVAEILDKRKREKEK